jgi:N-acyl homoserine lactone hydrolase
MRRRSRGTAAAVALAAIALAAIALPAEEGSFSVFGRIAGTVVEAQTVSKAVDRLRLYIFDLGFIPVSSARTMFSEPLEVAKDVCCIVTGHLIVHPKGTLMWDAGVVPDAQIGTGAKGSERAGKRSLKDQLAEIGYSSKNVTYFALSHYHFDHTANANDFRDSTWIVQQRERDAMFAGQPVPGVGPDPTSQFSALKDSKTIVLANIDEYDVFGDGTVIIKAAPGHTPGHQVLILRLAKTGRVILAGDLYHFPEERAAKLVPNIEFDKEQSRASRVRVEEYLRKNAATLWIEHDAHLYAGLKKSPGYIE